MISKVLKDKKQLPMEPIKKKKNSGSRVAYSRTRAIQQWKISPKRRLSLTGASYENIIIRRMRTHMFIGMALSKKKKKKKEKYSHFHKRLSVKMNNMKIVEQY